MEKCQKFPNDCTAQIFRIGSVGWAELDETLRILGVVLEVALLDAPRVEADLPAPVEDDLLVLVLVDVAEVDGVEVLQEVLVSDPEAAVVKGFSVEFPSIWRKKRLEYTYTLCTCMSLLPIFSSFLSKNLLRIWVFNLCWTILHRLRLARKDYTGSSIAGLQNNCKSKDRIDGPYKNHNIFQGHCSWRKATGIGS